MATTIRTSGIEIGANFCMVVRRRRSHLPTPLPTLSWSNISNLSLEFRCLMVYLLRPIRAIPELVTTSDNAAEARSHGSFQLFQIQVTNPV